MSEPNQEEPKIIVDSDWKEEARREKEEADRMISDSSSSTDIPPPSLMELVHMIAMQASLGLGGMHDPQTGQRIPPQLPIAKHYIDLLDLFQQKTAGHVDDNEKKMIDETLHELRLAFVHVANLIKAAATKLPPEVKPTA